MQSEKQHIDDFFRAKDEAFEPDNQLLPAHWQQMKQQLADPGPRAGNNKKGHPFGRHIKKFLGALITVIIIAVLAIKPFRSQKKAPVTKTKQSAALAVPDTSYTWQQNKVSDSVTVHPPTAATVSAIFNKPDNVIKNPFQPAPVEQPQTTTDTAKQRVNKSEPPHPDARALLNAFFKELEKPSQHFYIQPDRDTTIIAKEGTRLFIPANILMTKAGAVKGPVTIIIREYYRYDDMVGARLHTTSNGKQLITGGMIHVSAEQDGKPVTIAPQKAINVNMPTQIYDPEMQLFAGRELVSETENSSSLDWLPVAPLMGNMYGHGKRVKEFNINNVEPYSVNYGKKTTAKFYVSQQVSASRKEIIAQLKQRFGTYYDNIKVKRVRKSKSNERSPNGKPLVIDSTYDYEKPSKKAPAQLFSRQETIKYDNNRRLDSVYNVQQERMANTYGFALPGFGWYNCDKFTYDPRPKIDCIVNLGPGTTEGNHVSLLLFTKTKSMFRGVYNFQKDYYRRLPEGEPAILITVAVTADKVVSNIHTFTTSNDPISNLVFEPTTPQQFKQKLNALLAATKQ